MTKIKKILVPLAMLGVLSSSANAAELEKFSEFYIGGASVDNDTSTKSTVDFGWGFFVGEDFKFGGGIGYHYMDEDSKGVSGNYIDIDLKLGYEIYDDLIAYGLVGYAFQDVGDFTYNGKREDIASSGLGYGVGLSYYFSKHFGVKTEYRTYDMDFDIANTTYKYDLSSTSVALSFRF